MKFSLPQIRSVVEISRNGFHVSRAARHLNTSQSVISKHLKSFENALAGRVFTRFGKRLTGLTPEGENLLKYAERMLHDHACIEKIGQEASSLDCETLSLATTPTLARYLIANAVKTFTHAHPLVQLHIQVEESDKAVEAVRLGKCDLAIAPIGRKISSDLAISPLTHWTRLLIGTADCPLFKAKTISLEMIASEPIIAFETPTVSLKETFDKNGLLPIIALTTSNPEVMKAYAALGLGVAIVATPTFDALRDAPLVSRDVSGLFPKVQIAAVQKADSYHTAMQTRFLEYLRADLRGPSDAN